MPQTPREIVTAALQFSGPERLPRDLWTLPWGELHYPEAVAEMRRRFPSDFAGPPGVYRPSNRAQGEAHTPGIFVDDWGCTFENIQAGVIGEIRDPLVVDMADTSMVLPPPRRFDDIAKGCFHAIISLLRLAARPLLAPGGQAMFAVHPGHHCAAQRATDDTRRRR